MGRNKYPYEVGTRVRARCVITEGGGDTIPVYSAKFPTRSYVHARKGSPGTVMGIDDGVPTVRFDTTRTATVVGPHEVEPMDQHNPFWYTGDAVEMWCKMLADLAAITWEDALRAPEDFYAQPKFWKAGWRNEHSEARTVEILCEQGAL